MLGVRLTFNTPAAIKWLSDGTADWFWPAAEKAGLPVMVLAFGRMPQIAPIAERHPGLPIIIDHMGVNNVINKEGRMAQRISHFTETLTFLSEEDKDWVMGRSIRERLKWS